MDVSNGPDPVTVNTTGFVDTDPTVTMMFREPTAARPSRVKSAVIWVALAATLVMVTPSIELIIPPVKPLPRIVTATDVPGAPDDGVIDESVGPEVVTENDKALVVPSRVFAVTLLDPSEALVAMVNRAEICVALATRLLMVTPVMGLIDAPVRLLPLIVTTALCPCPMLAGLMDSNIGA
jgi:hypothetical protein